MSVRWPSWAPKDEFYGEKFSYLTQFMPSAPFPTVFRDELTRSLKAKDSPFLCTWGKFWRPNTSVNRRSAYEGPRLMLLNSEYQLDFPQFRTPVKFSILPIIMCALCNWISWLIMNRSTTSSLHWPPSLHWPLWAWRGNQIGFHNFRLRTPCLFEVWP